MVRGATAQFKFKLPYKASEFNWATIQFWQPNNNGTPTAPLPITKTLQHCDGFNVYKHDVKDGLSRDNTYCLNINNSYLCFNNVDIPSNAVLTWIFGTKTITYDDKTIPLFTPSNITDDMVMLELVNANTEAVSKKELCVTLDPTETMRFSDKIKARVQMRAQHISGVVIPTFVEYVTVYPMQDDLANDDLGGGTGTIDGHAGWIILDGQSVQ